MKWDVALIAAAVVVVAGAGVRLKVAAERMSERLEVRGE